MIKYALYTRKSHDDKKLTEKSTGEQLAECLAIADRDGLNVIWSCEESKSAKIPRVREKYTELIKLVEQGKVDGILCWHVNRLARNMEEGGKLVQLLVEGRIKEIRTPHATYRSGDNILPVVIEAASATQYSIDLGHTVSRSMEGSFRAGGCNYKAPPGYRNIRDPLTSKRGQVEPDPQRFELIERAWSVFLSGDHNVMDIKRRLDDWGYRMRQTLNLPERTISYPAVLAMLKNPFYAGFVRQKGELVRGRHEPMVTVEQFRRAQQLLAERTVPNRRNYDHPYTGLMRCGYCGQQVTAEVKQLRSGPWEVYRCSDTYHKCTKRGISYGSLEQQLRATVQRVGIDEEVWQVAKKSIERATRSVQSAHRTRQDQLQQSLKHLEARRSRLVEMWVSGLLSDESRYKDLEEKFSAEHAQLTLSSESGLDGSHVAFNLQKAEGLLTSATSRFERARPHAKRLVVQSLGQVHFFGREKRIELKLHPALAELAHFCDDIRGSFEPPASGSGSTKKAASLKPLYPGGPKQSRVEVPQSLLDLLASDRIELPEVETSFGISEDCQEAA